jgi:uncharacterized protein (DUF1015 family)
MATIKPLRGILYNPEIITDHSAVTAPPYDVISPEEQTAFYEKHPNNIIRLILNREKETDTSEDNPHTRSAEHFRTWQANGVLKRDDKPALYLKAVTFPHENGACTRYGLICLVGLEPFEKKIVLPHEKTFSKVKSERLKLMKVTRCNFSSIFSLYPDDGGILDRLEKSVDKSSPHEDFIDEQGHRHRLWRITDPKLHLWVENAMADKRLFIADGHHRYETALNYRKHLQETEPDFNDRHPANYILMYLCSMHDPGLIILPAHRLLKAVDGEMLNQAIEKSRSYFDVAEYPFTPENRNAVEKAFLSGLKNGEDRHSIGIYGRDQSVFYLLTLQAGAMDRLFEDELDPTLRVLDVTVLTRLLFMKILGFDQARLDNDQLIGYASTADRALALIDTNIYDVAFLLNPTRIEQVQDVARKGEIMPRKSTYFFPKVRSGLVMNTLEP